MDGKKSKVKLEDGVYIEEGSDLLKFEKDINKALDKLSVTREVRHIEFKTGIQENYPNGGKNWYSMAIYHQPKTSFELNNLLARIDKAEASANRLECYLRSIKHFEKYLRSAIDFEKYFKIFKVLEKTYMKVSLES